MFRVHGARILLKAGLVMLTLAFATGAFCAESDQARILPADKVYIMKGEKKVGELTREAPLPEGVFLTCEGKCAVRMKALYLEANDQSLFSIKNGDKTTRLTLKKGMIFFALSELPKTLVFDTPSGLMSTEEVLLDASGESVLKGYIKVAEGSAELGVVEGGSMKVASAKSSKFVKAGTRVRLAQAEVPSTKQGGPAAGGAEGLTTLEGLGISAAAVAAVPTTYELTEEDHDEEPASPASP